MRIKNHRKTLGNLGVTQAAFAGVLALGALFAGCDKSTNSSAGCKATLNASNPSAQIHLLAPTGCDNFHVGDVMNVKWTLTTDSAKNFVNAVDIMLSLDDGQKWIPVLPGSIPYSDPSWGNVAWTIPDSVSYASQTYHLANNSQVLVKVEQYSTDNPDYSDQTTQTLTILAKP